MKLASLKKNKFDIIFLSSLLLIFILYKLSHLQLPYYWDEAWSYIPAIHEMFKVGPSLMPNSISPELYRGHPLLFYFLSSSWMLIFGTSVISLKSFALLIAAVTLIVFYKFANQFFGRRVAVISSVFLTIQSVFLVQSSFLLPEVLLSLLTLLSFLSYFSGKKILTCIWLTLALLTKESGLVIWLTIFLLSMFTYFRNFRNGETKNVIKEFWFLGIPIAIIAGFFILQKIIVGWYFFPEHLDFIVADKFFNRLHGYSAYVFIYKGRNLITLAGIIAILILIFSKKAKNPEELKYVYALSLFVVLYLLFSSFNFYSPRYIISILPFTLLILIFLIDSVLEKKKVLLLVVLLVLFINNAYFTFTQKGDNDDSLGFRNAVLCHKKAINYCEENNFQNLNIATHFLMEQNLKNNLLGYIDESSNFSYVSNVVDEKTDIAIISSTEFDEGFKQKINSNNAKLLIRFEEKNSWTEIYILK